MSDNLEIQDLVFDDLGGTEFSVASSKKQILPMANPNYLQIVLFYAPVVQQKEYQIFTYTLIQ